MIKNAKNAGADNFTPSVPQYFSWINNTNEGSTEEHTLVNLEFFKYLKDTYGMSIKIYAWDAGNFDGASEGYGDLNGEKFRSQYPEGYKNIVEKAKEQGIRLGLWGSPDGYGDTEETQKERFDFFVHLCKDYDFALFKLDGVCGHLRPEKAGVFADMLKECRKYSPDLIVLNHRLEFYEAEKHITTYLWNGTETYVDILSCNANTAMHHRGFMFERGHTDNLERLAEDHGVCISSNIDYFEDELIYQAFNRSLILAPEIYGNPWLMRDDELPKLARIYNLHGRNAEILVNGMLLPESFGANACARGSKTKRFISTGNNSWETKKITFTLGEEIGLDTDKTVQVNIHHPYEEYLGEYRAGDKVEIDLMPFRATLVEVSVVDEAEPILTSCKYEIVKENENGVPVEVKILTCNGGDINIINKGNEVFFVHAEKCDTAEKAPVYLGELTECEKVPVNGEELYETAMYAISNDALEARSILRSGETEIPEVKAARDAFFGQPHYRLRGCEAKNMFDGKPDTFYDSQSKTYCDNNLRINNGCLRVDFGAEYDCDSVEIEFFSGDYPTREVAVQNLPLVAEYSCDLKKWSASDTVSTSVSDDDFTATVIKYTAHTLYNLHGKKITASYNINGKIRYMRIENPVDRIYAVRLIKDGREIKTDVLCANNMQAHPRHKKINLSKSGEFTLPEYRSGARLTVAVNGKHGEECVYCVAEIGDKRFGFPERAPDYKANQWEHRVCGSDKNNTFFLPLPDGMAGETVKIYTLFTDRGKGEKTKCYIYICEKH
ncbi:MAG: hypothetical protein IJN81_07465 [Clostridia bacterium]|nr:hypothetical protein [Clostridia bacterium]